MVKFRNTGIVWEIELSHNDVVNLELASTLAPIPDPEVKAAIRAMAEVIKYTDKIGGNKGVAITGVVGYFVVTPAGQSPYDKFKTIGKQSVEAIEDTWKSLFGKKTKKHVPGAVAANRDKAGEWEEFGIAALPDGKIAVLSWQGYFSAEGGGGKGVYANRDEIGEWEKWDLEYNDNGTVSLKSINGHYFVAEEGGGSVCNANRPAKGPWERFFMEFHANGTFSLKTEEKHKYVTVLD